MEKNHSMTGLALTCTLGMATILMPAQSHAGSVGYYRDGSCSSAGDYAARITAAGHTPVAVANLDAASLASLDGLVAVQGCNGNAFQGTNQAVNDAVAGGMPLFLEIQDIPGGSGVTLQLPGIPSLPVTDGCSLDVSLATGSPVANGPGGALTNASLDNAVLCSLTSWVDGNALPSDGIPLLVDAADPSKVGALGYVHGSGQVIFSMDQFMYTMTGGSAYASYPTPGSDAYITNAIAWMMPTVVDPQNTCASEGSTGTKLTWCKNICEMGYTGATLDIWIHRWINRYRDLPYCAQEGGGEEEPPPQEA